MDLGDLYRKLTASGVEAEGVENVFIAGYREFSRLQQKNESNGVIAVENAQRAMRIELVRELELLDSRLSFLATVGSTSPYVGLFGTVWGIMNSFRSLGNAQQATLAQVAPGIAEALIATAMGVVCGYSSGYCL
jgi:Cell division and transport-associated protein TolQ (TC 2.C.1.2.1)